jgi:hypothetical protein
MTAITLKGPTGIYPKVSPDLLVDNGLQIAENCRLDAGVVVPMATHLQVDGNPDLGGTNALAKGAAISAFGFRYNNTLYINHWLTEVSCHRASVDNDEKGRMIIIGDYEPKICSEEMAAVGADTTAGVDQYPFTPAGAGMYPRATYMLGVPKPIMPPRVYAEGSGSGSKVERSYVYTYVDPWGYESAPSPPSPVTLGYPDQTWNIRQIESIGNGSTRFPDGEYLPNSNMGITYVKNNTPSSTVTLYCEGRNYTKKGHRITISGMTGNWAYLNGTHTVADSEEVCYSVKRYKFDGTSLRVELESVSGLSVDDRVYLHLRAGAATAPIKDLMSTVVTVSVTGDTLSESAPYVTFGAASTAAFVTPKDESYILLSTITLNSAVAFASASVTASFARVTPFNCGNLTGGHAGYRIRIYRQEGTVNSDFYMLTERKADKALWPVDPDGIPSHRFNEKKKSIEQVKMISDGWELPPGDLAMGAYLPQGFHVGAKGRYIYASVPNYPYAWPQGSPTDYRRVTEHPILAIKAASGTLVVLTQGFSYLGDGPHPSAFSLAKRPHVFKCRSGRSAIVTYMGVLYTSDHGWVVDGPGLPEPTLVSLTHFDTWQFDRDVVQQNVRAGRYRGVVFMWDGVNGWIMAQNGVLTTHTQAFDCFFEDTETNKTYIVNAGNVLQWEGGSTFETAKIKTKAYRTTEPTWMTVGEVISDYVLPGTSTPSTVTFKYYGDGVLLITKTLSDSKAFRLPGLVRPWVHEVELTFQSRIKSTVIAQMMEEVAKS